MKPHISVVLPVCGAAPYLRAALRTLLWQDFAQYEVLLVDDGMGAYALQLAHSMAQRDPRLRYLKNPDPGLCGALNSGIHAARADVIARMDSDDLCHPRRLSIQFQALQRGLGGVVGCLVRSFPRRSIRPGWRSYENWLNSLRSPQQHRRDLWVESPLCHPSVLTWRNLLLRVGGYRQGDFPEDYDLWLRLSTAGVDLYKVPQPLFLWRDQKDRLTRSDSRYRPQAFRQLKAGHLAAHFDLRRRGVMIWGAGKEGRQMAKALLALEIRIGAFIDVDRKKIGRSVYDVPVLSYQDSPWQIEPQPLVLVAIGTKGVRDTVRWEISNCGLVEGRTFVMVC